ncbi:MAG: glycosyltransferase family 39 protein [Sandaracinaceae bacterium]
MRTRRGALAGLWLALLAGTSHVRAQDVIGPGHEERFRAMFDVTLPTGCRFASASIEATRASGRYACEASELVVHLERARPDAARTTERFTLRAEGDLDEATRDAILDAVEVSVRVNEAGFTWGDPVASSPSSAPSTAAARSPLERAWRAGFRRALPSPVALALTTLAALALIVLALGRFVRDAAPVAREPSPRWVPLALVAVIAVGVALRAAASVRLGWDGDEPMVLPTGDPHDILRNFEVVIHPPLFRALVSLLPGIGACPPRWLPRLVSVIGSGATIAVVYAMVRPYARPSLALLAPALLAITPLDVYVGSLARPYALVELEVAMGAWGALAFLDDRASRAHLAAMGLAMLTLAWTDYAAWGAAMLGALGLLVVRLRRRRSAAWLAVATLVAGALTMGPWVPAMMFGSEVWGSHHAAIAGSSRGEMFVGLAAFGAAWTGSAVGALVALAMLLVGLFDRRLAPWCAAVLAACLGAALAAELLVLRARNVAFLTPLVAASLAMVLGARARTSSPALAIGALLLLLLRLPEAATALGLRGSPPGWASSPWLAERLQSLAPRVALGHTPLLVDADHDRDRAMVRRALFADACEPPVLDADDPDVREGRAIGAVAGCRLPPLDATTLYVRRELCRGPPPPGCEPIAGDGVVALLRCTPR